MSRLTLLAICGCAQKERYLDIVMVAIVGALIARGFAFGAS